MIRRIKIGKVVVAIFITGLIWVWADLAETEEFPVENAAIAIAQSTDPNLWISFEGGPMETIQQIILKGPASKRADFEGKLREHAVTLDFLLYPSEHGMNAVGTHSLDVANFLEGSAILKPFGLTVKSCEPTTLSVNVIGLVKKTLKVDCVDTDGNQIKDATVNPDMVDMFVPEDWVSNARVELNAAEMKEARLGPVPRAPFVRLPGGHVKHSSATVEVKLPRTPVKLQEFNITPATPGVLLSTNMVGKYDVELLNPDDMATVSIMATLTACDRYRNQPFHMTIYVRDSDKKTTTVINREVVYNFPEESLRNDEIRLKGPAVIARFKLIPLPIVDAVTPPAK